MKRWKERIRRWKFDRKMQALVIVSITFTTLIVLAVSTISSVTSLKKKSMELLQDKNDTLAKNYQNMLEEYKAMSIALAIDKSVQRYLGCEDKRKSEYTAATTEAYNVLSSSLNISLLQLSAIRWTTTFFGEESRWRQRSSKKYMNRITGRVKKVRRVLLKWVFPMHIIRGSAIP